MADEHPPSDPPRSPYAPDAADGAVPPPASAPAAVSASTPNGGRFNARTKAPLLAALVIIVSIAVAFGGRVIADLPKYPPSANSNVRQPWISSNVASTWSPEGNQTDELKTWTNESDCLANAESGWLRIIREEPRLPETGVQADTGIDTPRNDAEAIEVLITEYLGLVTNFSQTVTEVGTLWVDAHSFPGRVEEVELRILRVDSANGTAYHAVRPFNLSENYLLISFTCFGDVETDFTEFERFVHRLGISIRPLQG